MEQVMETDAAAQAHKNLTRTLETIRERMSPLGASLQAISEATTLRELTDRFSREQVQFEAILGPAAERERMLQIFNEQATLNAMAIGSFGKSTALDLLREREEQERAQLGALLSPQNELQSLLAAFEKDLRPLHETLEESRRDAARHCVTDLIESERSWLRAALGPAGELGLAGTPTAGSVLNNAFESARKLFADYQSRFRLPDLEEAKSFFADDRLSNVFSASGELQKHAIEIQRAAEAMRVPWLDMQDKLQSFAGFAELQRIGLSLRESHPFDERLADLLRTDLGDWRGTIAFPEGIFTDPWKRTEFYADRGLDPRLTRFPRGAFEQGISIAGLRDILPPFLDEYDGRAGEKDEEEAGFERTNDAHKQLMLFEHQLRRFIDTAMTAAFGEHWTRHRAPGEIRKSWLEKQQRARDDGEPDRPLIAYADFTDYVRIIMRRDNWDEVFKPVFRRQESVQESFQRLYPIRICTMHARIITQDDQLYLYAETKRILSAIRVKSCTALSRATAWPGTDL